MLGHLLRAPSFVEPDDVRELVDGAQVEVAGLSFGALHAPGHTPGSIMFQTAYDAEPEPGVDSPRTWSSPAMCCSPGRSAEPTCPAETTPTCWTVCGRKVLPLPDSVVVLPGHGPQTTMARERAGNPYLQELM